MNTEKENNSYKDEWTLRRLYHEKKLPMSEIAENFGVATDTIRYWMDKHEIERRNKSHAHRIRHAENDAAWKDEETLRKEYVKNGRTSLELAEMWECDPKTVRNWLRRFGITVQESGEWQSQGCASYFQESDGYMRWMDYSQPSRGDSVPVHRLLAIAEYGVNSVKGMHVHHRNGIKWDNRPENIELITPEEHAKMHYRNGDLELEHGGIDELKNELEQ